MKIVIVLTLLLAMPYANAEASDERMIVALNNEQQAFLLDHMRDMLEALTDAQQLLLEGNRDALQQRIIRLQTNEKANRPNGMGQRIPPAFRAMAQSMQPHWQAIQNPTTLEIEARQHAVDLMRICNACHRTFTIHSSSISP